MRVLFLLLIALAAARADVPTLDPSELRSGETGYGLSVFQGTAVERFDVTVIGVVKNVMAGQDMILIRCAGHGLEHAKIVAGMSGSPIYVRDRLIGALAYGWSFSADPIAGVTPIKNMLDELKLAAAPGSPPAGLTRLANPLLISGVPEKVLARFEPRLQELGWLPVTGAALGGAPLSASVTAPASALYEPGSAIAVHLARGDVSMAAIGTVTHRDGAQVLAFGHPFQGAGALSLPAGPASIVTVLPRLSTSFKMGQPAGEAGAMVWDGQAAIHVDASKQARMVPVRVATRDLRRNLDRAFAVDVAANPLLTPMLVQMVLSAILESCGGSSDDLTTRVHVKATFSGGRTAEIDDLFYVGREGLASGEPFARVLAPLENAFSRLELTGLTTAMTFEPGRRTAQIRRAAFDTAALTPGRDARVSIWLKPYGQPEVRRTVRFAVPADAAGTNLEVAVQAGEKAAPDVAPPETADDALAALARRPRASDLVVTLAVPGRRLAVRGRVLERLPRSVLPILETPHGGGPTSTPELARVVDATPWVIQGALKLKIPVKEVAFE